MWQHVNLSEQIRPWGTLACCWDVKQPTNNSITEVCLSLLLKCVCRYYRSVFVAITEVCLSLLQKCVCRYYWSVFVSITEVCLSLLQKCVCRCYWSVFVAKVGLRWRLPGCMPCPGIIVLWCVGHRTCGFCYCSRCCCWYYWLWWWCFAVDGLVVDRLEITVAVSWALNTNN